MGVLHSYNTAVYHGDTRATQAVVEATTIYGNKVIWDVSTVGAAYTVTVGEYDQTDYKNYDVDVNGQPILVIVCSSDCSVFNVAVKSSDGAGSTTTHATFAADYSTTSRTVVLRLSATLGADGKRLWERAVA